MYKKIFSAILILFVIASILTVSTASDYSKEDLISHDTTSKKIKILNVENENIKVKEIKKNDIKKQDIVKVDDNKKELPKTEDTEDKKNLSEPEKKVNPSKNNLTSNSKDNKKDINETKKEVRTQAKAQDKPESKPTPKPQAKPQPKPESKPAPQPQAKPQPKPQAPVSSSREYETEVIRLVNIERQKNGLSNLTESSNLSKVARYKSQDMINKNYFSHESPTYGSPFNMMKKFGISYRAAGENIAAGQRTPKDVVNAWMNSEGHRANILNSKFNQIGIGFIKDSNNYCFWTQMFIG
ncbi:MAG: CAP domain-containing protein [Senegalia sp. (in: firmicutes)]|uniref:CAP domain-containing protein n=1 Tax=Senegalia sp. (in: firmicutes) TaxID=1924098 RepID=UPI003F9D920D